MPTNSCVDAPDSRRPLPLLDLAACAVSYSFNICGHAPPCPPQLDHFIFRHVDRNDRRPGGGPAAALTALLLLHVALSALFLRGGGLVLALDAIGLVAAPVAARTATLLALVAVFAARRVAWVWLLSPYRLTYTAALLLGAFMPAAVYVFQLLAVASKQPYGAVDVIGVVVFAAGVVVTTVAELQRAAFKQRGAGGAVRGRPGYQQLGTDEGGAAAGTADASASLPPPPSSSGLYTGGLFAYVQHAPYTGEILR